MLGPGHYNYGNSSAAGDDDGDAAAAEEDKQKLDSYGATTDNCESVFSTFKEILVYYCRWVCGE